MFYQIFLSPQMKRCAIITYKHGIYELPHELPKDLRLRILYNDRLAAYNDSLVPILPAKIIILLIPVKTLEKQKLDFFRSALFHMKARVSLKYFVNDCGLKSL